MTQSSWHELERCYQERTLIAKEIKASGVKVVGYFCCYFPVEIVTSLGMLPYRILGNTKASVSQADAYLETIMCPFLRNCFAQAINGQYDFLDGIVVPHTCDNIYKVYDVWTHNCKTQFRYFINVPHMVHPASFQFFKAELQQFSKSLEELAGAKISEQKLREATAAHNRSRALLRELNGLRKKRPALISGADASKISIAGTALPVTQFNKLLSGFLVELKGRRHQGEQQPRLLLYANEIDEVALVQLLEDCGASVVLNDTCLGARCIAQDVELSKGPLDGLVTQYLETIGCPRTYKVKTGGHQDDLQQRFGHLLTYARDFGVDGIVCCTLRFCDTFGFDLPHLREFLEQNQFPALFLEVDYTLGDIGRLRTRVEAFLEMVSGKIER